MQPHRRSIAAATRLKMASTLDCIQLGDGLVQWELDSRVNCIDCEDESGYVVCGHDLGVSVLKPDERDAQRMERIFFHLGRATRHICVKREFIAAVHVDTSISLINIDQGSVTILQSKQGHFGSVNSVDIAIQNIGAESRPLVASTGDDRLVAVWQDDGTLLYKNRLASAGRSVRFFDQDANKLAIVEQSAMMGQGSVRLLNWATKTLAYTIYGGGVGGAVRGRDGAGGEPNNSAVQDVYVGTQSAINRDGGIVLAVGEGWFKTYNLNSLQGSSGYTEPDHQGQLVGAGEPGSLVKSSSNARYVGMVNSEGIKSYDMAHARSATELYGTGVAHKLGCQFTDMCVHVSGRVAAACGPTIVVLQI